MFKLQDDTHQRCPLHKTHFLIQTSKVSRFCQKPWQVSVQYHRLTMRQTKDKYRQGERIIFLYNFILSSLDEFLAPILCKSILKLDNPVDSFISLFTGNIIHNRLWAYVEHPLQIRWPSQVSCILLTFSKWLKLLMNLTNIYQKKRELQFQTKKEKAAAAEVKRNIKPSSVENRRFLSS